MSDQSLQMFAQMIGYAQRENKFIVSFPSPFESEDKILAYTVRSGGVPSKGMGMVTMHWHGLTVRLPGDHEVAGTFTLTFTIDKKNKTINTIEGWMANTFDSFSNSRAAIEDVKVPISFKLLGPNLEVISTFVVIGCFPTMRGEIALDRNSTNTVASLPVTFAYDDVDFEPTGGE